MGKGSAKNRIPCITVSILLTGSCFAFYKLTGALYGLQLDNYYIGMVTASLFDQNNWCCYINPVLCWVIKQLNTLYDGADWFSVLTQMNVFAGAVWFFYCVLQNKKTTVTHKILLSLWMLFTLIKVSVWNENFTVQSAFFSFIGYTTLFYKNKNVRGKGVIALYFVVLGICWRVESALLFVPFAILKAACRRMRKQSDPEYEDAFHYKTAVVIAVVLLFIGIHYGVKYIPSNLDSTRYNNARTTLEDYPTLKWENLPEQAVFQEVDYQAAKKWYLLDTEVLSTETLEYMAALGRRTWNYYEMLYYAYTFLGLIMDWNGCTVFMTLWLFYIFIKAWLTRKDRIVRTELVLDVLGGFVIWLYLIKMGRAPLRVVDSLGYAVFFAVMSELWEGDSQNRRILWKVTNSAYALMLACVLISTVAHSERIQTQWALKSNTDQEIIRTDLPVNGDTLYIWTGFTFGQDYMFGGKLIPSEIFRHHISDGDWTYGQPYHNAFLRSINAENPAASLLTRENTFLVSENSDFLLQFMSAHYGEDIRLIRDGELLGIPVWRLNQGE